MSTKILVFNAMSVAKKSRETALDVTCWSMARNIEVALRKHHATFVESWFSNKISRGTKEGSTPMEKRWSHLKEDTWNSPLQSMIWSIVPRWNVTYVTGTWLGRIFRNIFRAFTAPKSNVTMATIILVLNAMSVARKSRETALKCTNWGSIKIKFRFCWSWKLQDEQISYYELYSRLCNMYVTCDSSLKTANR